MVQAISVELIVVQGMDDALQSMLLSPPTSPTSSSQPAASAQLSSGESPTSAGLCCMPLIACAIPLVTVLHHLHILHHSSLITGRCRCVRCSQCSTSVRRRRRTALSLRKPTSVGLCHHWLYFAGRYSAGYWGSCGRPGCVGRFRDVILGCSYSVGHRCLLCQISCSRYPVFSWFPAAE